MKSRTFKILLTALTAMMAFMCAFIIMTTSVTKAETDYDFSIVNGAEVKILIDQESSGLRFSLNLNTEDYQLLQDDNDLTKWNDGVKVGMLLVPVKYYNNDLTLNSQSKYVINQELAPSLWKDAKVVGYKTSYVAVYDFPESYYTEDIMAVGYLSDGSNVEYTDVIIRSMAQIAYYFRAEHGDTVKDYWYDSASQTNRTFTVKFDTDGAGEIVDKEVAIGSAIGQLDAISKDGYYLNKWYDVTDTEKTAWDLENSEVVKNLTLKADFVAKQNVNLEEIETFEVYKSATVTLNSDNVYEYALTANTLDVDLSALNLDLSDGVTAKFKTASGDKQATASVNGNVVSIDGGVLGSKIYGEGISVEIDSKTAVITANIGTVVTKYVDDKDDFNKLPFYGNLDRSNEDHNYYGYFVMTADLDYEGQAIEYRGEKIEYGDLATDAHNTWGGYGFKGIFDGKDHKFIDVYVNGSKSGGLFLNTSSSSELKNFSVNVNMKQTGSYWFANTIGKHVGSKITNVDIGVVVMEGSSTTTTGNGYFPVGYQTAYARLIDVNITFDARNVPEGAGVFGLSNYAARGIGNNAATFANTTIEVIKPEWKGQNDIQIFGAYYGDYTLDTTGLTYTVLADEQVIDTTAYEVYSSVTDTTANFNANKLTTALDTKGQNISKVTVKGVNNDTAVEVASDKYSYANNTLSIDASVFGSNIYGDVQIAVQLDKTATVITKPIITKYISEKADVENLFIYGSATKYENGGAPKKSGYDGYFVMTNNINVSAWLLAYRAEQKDNYYQFVGLDGNAETGFKGIFDGKGYTMYDYVAADRIGIFGNVAKTGVVKNLGIKGKMEIKTSWQKETYTLGYNFCGTLENCFIDMTVATDSLNNAIATAHFLGHARFEDVVIKCDSTKANYNTEENRFGWLACQVAESNQWNTLQCENVSVFVQLPSDFDVATGTLTPGSWYGTEPALTGITRYEYDAKPTISMTDKTCWTITEGAQITWKSLSTIA